MIGTRIILTKAEIRLSRHIGRGRIENDEWKKDIISDKGKLNPVLWLAETFGSELAFCRLHNVYPEIDILGPSPIDARLSDGTSIDVKMVYKEHHRLLRRKDGLGILPDYYSLMYMIVPWEYIYFGSMKCSDLIQECRLDTSMRVPGYAAERWELYEICSGE